MVLPLIPLAIGGAGLLTGAGAYFGLKGQAPDEITTYKNSYQTDYITTTTDFNLSGAKIEKGANISFSPNVSTSTKKSAKQEDAINRTNGNSLDIKTLLIVGGVALGGYYIFKK